MPFRKSCGKRRALKASLRYRAASRELRAIWANGPRAWAIAMASWSVSGAGCWLVIGTWDAVNAVTSTQIPPTSNRLVMWLFISKTHDGVLFGGALRRNDSEQKSDGHRHAEGDDHGFRRHRGGDFREPLDGVTRQTA